MKLRFLLAGVVVAAGVSVAGMAAAATPTFSLSLSGSDSAQISVTGDPNANATLFYNIGSSQGAMTSVLGTTDASGQLTKTISAGALNLNTGNSLYVIVNGQQSGTQPWSSSGSGTTGSPSLSQTNATVTVNQTITIVSQNSATGVYMLSNSNPNIASVATGGTQINVTGSQVGVTTVTLCYVGTTANCTTLTVTVQASGTTTTGTSGSVTFDQPNPVVSVGGTLTVTIFGGSTFYVSTNSNPSIMTYVLNGNAMMLRGQASGTALISVCSVSGGCGQLSVTVGASQQTTTTTSGQNGVSFSITNPSVVVNQTINVTLTGATTYFVSVNTNPITAQTNVSGNMLMITGVSAGTTTLTVCAAGGTICGTLPVTVTTTAVTPTPATVTTPSVVSPVTYAPTTNSAALTITIATMQNQLAQMLLAIQAMQIQLNQILATLPGASATVATPAASTPFSGKFTGFLSLQSTGAEVTALQKKLSAEGYYSGPITGTFGALTEAAVKKYQTANGLDAAGYVGPATRAALNQ